MTRIRLVLALCALACAASAAGPAAALGADLTPPVTTCDAPQAWQRASFVAHFSATDADSGVATIWAGLDGAEPQRVGDATGGSLAVEVPADGSFDGTHTLSYFAIDAAGNAEPAHIADLRIDATAPAVTVRAAAGWQGLRLRLSYRVRDLSPSAAVTLTVSDAGGSVVATLAPGSRTTGVWHTAGWTPRSPGAYTYTAAAADRAGNAGVSAAAAAGVTALSRFVLGRSVHGRALRVVRFGAGERRLLIVGGAHGNESGTAVARGLRDYLLAHPRALPEGARIDLLACENPDGFAAHTRGNARRVDLNRNLPTRDWRSRLRSGDPSGWMGLTGGRSPGSEPETKALLRLLAERFDVVVSLHSRAGLLDCSGPGSRALGRRMSARCGLPLGKVSYDPYITGSLGRYVPQKYDIPIVTVELLSGRLYSGMRAALLEAAR